MGPIEPKVYKTEKTCSPKNSGPEKEPSCAIPNRTERAPSHERLRYSPELNRRRSESSSHRDRPDYSDLRIRDRVQKTREGCSAKDSREYSSKGAPGQKSSARYSLEREAANMGRKHNSRHKNLGDISNHNVAADLPMECAKNSAHEFRLQNFHSVYPQEMEKIATDSGYLLHNQERDYSTFNKQKKVVQSDKGSRDYAPHDLLQEATFSYPLEHAAAKKGKLPDQNKPREIPYRRLAVFQKTLSEKRQWKLRRDERLAMPVSEVLLFTQLKPSHCDEDLRRMFANANCADEVVAIRILRNYETRKSHNMAFVKFSTIESAKKFMEELCPSVKYSNNIIFDIEYTRSYLLESDTTSNWTCIDLMCAANNEPEAYACRACGLEKPVLPEDSEGLTDMTPVPTKLLLVEDLDVSCNVTQVYEAFYNLAHDGGLPIPQQARLLRSKDNNESMCRAYLTYDSVQAVEIVLDYIRSNPAFKNVFYLLNKSVQLGFGAPQAFKKCQQKQGVHVALDIDGTPLTYWRRAEFAETHPKFTPKIEE